MTSDDEARAAFDVLSVPDAPPAEVRSALTLILLSARPERGVERLSAEGVLKRVLPEVEDLHGVEQPREFHPEGDVFVHTMRMLSHAAWRTPLLMWSILLHDIGKAPARTVDPSGVPHFYGHESIGADMADRLLLRLEMPDRERVRIVSVIRNHMRFAHADRIRRSKLVRILHEENFPLELELNRIDCISSHGILDSYLFLLDRLRMLREEERLAPPPPFLTGKDLIAAGYPPGPEFRRILDECGRLQRENRLTSREEALTRLKQGFFSA